MLIIFIAYRPKPCVAWWISEPPKALKTSTNPALQPRSVSPAENKPGPQKSGPTAVIGQSASPGKVKAIMSQRYNTPIGLYSDNEVMTQFTGQSKFLLTPDQEDG
jgi:hypothetical protein